MGRSGGGARNTRVEAPGTYDRRAQSRVHTLNGHSHHLHFRALFSLVRENTRPVFHSPARARSVFFLENMLCFVVSWQSPDYLDLDTSRDLRSSFPRICFSGELTCLECLLPLQFHRQVSMHGRDSEA